MLREDRAVLRRRLPTTCWPAPMRPSIYEVPISLLRAGLRHLKPCERLGLAPARDRAAPLARLPRRAKDACFGRVWTIAVVGKYVSLPDAYLSVIEALAARRRGRRGASVERATSSTARSLPTRTLTRVLGKAMDGILVPGGFGAARLRGQDRRRPLRPRATMMPVSGHLPGACRSAVCEFARNVLRLGPAPTPPSSADVGTAGDTLVIDLMPEQEDVERQGRHHAPRAPTPASWCPARRAAAAYGDAHASTSATATASR